MQFNAICLIGNGFDLHFKLPTSYTHFENYIAKKYPNEKHFVESFYNTDSSTSSLWSDFESNIANVDKEQILDYTNDPEEAQELYGWQRLFEELFKRLSTEAYGAEKRGAYRWRSR